MTSIGIGYYLSVTTFSPDGRVFQVEYASKAVDNSGYVSGAACCVVYLLCFLLFDLCKLGFFCSFSVQKFGFASCRRHVGAAQGLNVLRGEKRWEYAITCIEYTEFSKLSTADVPVSSSSMEAQYPAMDVLYMDLAAVERIAPSCTAASLPEMIMNLKKSTVFYDQHGLKHSVRGGRIECTMQNVADLLANRKSSPISPEKHGFLSCTYIYPRKVVGMCARDRGAIDKGATEITFTCFSKSTITVL